MDIHHKPNRNYIGETFFVYFLRQHFPQANYIKESYQIDKKYLDNFVDKNLLIKALEKNQYLTQAAKKKCLDKLRDDACPTNIKVALNPASVSFDVVITSDDEIYYWEFHEDQHRKLSVTDYYYIYNAENDQPYSVPRYVQRLVRDVWRLQNFFPYTIIWKDWFLVNYDEYEPKLQLSFNEKVLKNKFSFESFLE